MGFDELLGNEQLKIRVSETVLRQRVPHCILISGAEGSGKRTLTGLLAAALQCTGDAAPCGVCPQCRKARNGLHPDVIFVDDESKKTIPVELVREKCADVFIRPNEGRRKIYIFPHAEKLTVIDQNTLLKVLEEPPTYAVFLLLTPNPGLLLPTVRSRCAELHLAPLPEETLLPALRGLCPGHTESEYREAAACGYLGQARALLEREEDAPETVQLLRAFARRSALELLQVLTPMEKWKRDQLLAILQDWEARLTLALSARFGAGCADDAIAAVRENRTAREILEAVEALREAQSFCNANVSSAAICGALAVRLAK